MGTAQLGMDYGIANRDGKPGREAAVSLVQYAVGKGVRYFDTARAYGSSEEVLGEALKGAERSEQSMVVTKLSPEFVFTNYTNLKREIEMSLARLRMPKVWGVLLHRFDISDNWPSFLKAVKKLKGEGLIDNFGVSVYDPEEALFFASAEGVDIIQVPLNIIDRRLRDAGFFDLTEKNETVVFGRSIFLQGLFFLSKEELEEKGMGWARPHLAALRDFLITNELALKDFAIQALLRFFPSLILVVGVESKIQLEENLQIMGRQNIPDWIIKAWWDNLPVLPERLLNPSLWH